MTSKTNKSPAAQKAADKAAKAAENQDEGTVTKSQAAAAVAAQGPSIEQNLAEASRFAEQERQAAEEANADPSTLVAKPKNAQPSPGLKPERSHHNDPVGEPAETVRVLIKKDETTTIPKRVFSHEVVILQELWGVDNIEVVEGSELDQPLIGPVVERVSARRIEFLTEAFRHAGFDPTHAANRARLAYSAYVGFVQLSRIGQPRMSHEEFEAYIRDFIDTLVPR